MTTMGTATGILSCQHSLRVQRIGDQILMGMETGTGGTGTGLGISSPFPPNTMRHPTLQLAIAVGTSSGVLVLDLVAGTVYGLAVWWSRGVVV